MMSLRLQACALALWIAACSGADSTSARTGAPAVPVPGNTGGTAGAPGATAPGSFGNANNPVQQVANHDAGRAMTMMPVVKANDPVSIDNCSTSPAGLNAADVQKLMAGGAAANLRMLYPYDGTVFPRGILAPTLMWDGATGVQSVYVHIQAQRFEYKGCLKPTADGQLTLPEDIWAKAGEKTIGTADPFKVELTVMGSGAAMGPISSTWTIAQATIKGSIYYNSYSSKLANAGMMMGGFFGGGGPGGGSGAVLRIQKGKSAEVFINSQGCTACHSVSATGNRIVAYPFMNPAGSSYPVTPTSAANPNPLNTMLPNSSFTGVYPDGSLFVTNAHQNNVGARAGGPGAVGDPDAKVFETDTGTEVLNTGVPVGAMTPMFSPDGLQLAFTDYALAQAHGLAVMRFDLATRKASDERTVFTESDMKLYPAWPFFLPDDKALVFAIGSAPDFSGMGVGLDGGATGADIPKSDLYFVDLASGTSKMLAKAMGFASEQDIAGDKTYLPFGAEELHHHYYPTVAPVPAGGYFWVLFDSWRHYGNQGLQRQLWGTAVDVSADGTYAADPSHPAFYLTGQEAATGNHRAFAALDPCMKDGDTCTSGTDCCGGFCYVTDDKLEFEAVGSCTSHPPSCSKTNERCTTSGDCCDPEPGQQPNICIAGYCAMVRPVQ
jgi:hypothetical protein